MYTSSGILRCVGVGLVLSLAALRSAGAVEGALEEVIVTAQKREQNIQDVPSSVTALDESYLETRGLDELRDYSRFVPGFIYGTTAGGGERSGPDITIRGVSNTRLGGFDTSIASATTGYVFGEFPMYSMDARVADIARVEVLKGPQGTLYGAGAMGGILKVVPNPPRADAFSGSIFLDTSMTTDGGDNFGWNGYLNLPIVEDVLAVRIAGYSYEDSGYIDAKTPRGMPGELRGRNTLITVFDSNDVAVFPVTGASVRTVDNIDSETVTGVRVALRYTPNEKFDATLAAFLQTTDLASFHNFEPVLTSEQNKRVTEIFLLQPEQTENFVTSLELHYDFGPLTLTSISGWLNRTFKQSADLTTTVYGIFGGNGTSPVPTAVPTSFNADIDVYSEELRLQGTVKDLGFFSSIDWTLGYFYQREDRQLFNDVFPGPEWNPNVVPPVRPIPSASGYLYSATYGQNYTNNSVFADVTFNITPKFSISGGARRAEQDLDSLRQDFGGLSGSAAPPTLITQAVAVAEAPTTARGALSYKLTDNQLYYVSASEGFRIGGGNPSAVVAPSPACQDALQQAGLGNDGTYDSDNIWNYEVGGKTTWNDGRVVSNLSVYQIDWTDLQSTIFLGVFNPGCTATVTTNAGKARIRGVELDVQALVTDSLQVAVAASFAEAEVTDPESSSLAREGDPLKNIPDYSVTVGVEYDFPMMLNMDGYVRADYSAIGERSVSPVTAGQLPGFTLPPYQLLNLRLGASYEKWDFALYVDNVLDRAAQLDVLRRPGGPGVFPSTGPAPGVPAGTQLYISTNQPRTSGFTVRRSF